MGSDVSIFRQSSKGTRHYNLHRLYAGTGVSLDIAVFGQPCEYLPGSAFS
ncbi:MAG: hypothetical protein MUF15_19720 [Acidobacteria bacterium]|nr:hypothetical protein [Acidobacteriota bacterium]